MNLDTSKVHSLKVTMFNPMSACSRLLITKLLTGSVFGQDQLVQLQLLSNPGEVEKANAFKINLEKCAFSCMSSVTVDGMFSFSSLDDRNIIIISNNLPNPNRLLYSKDDYQQKKDLDDLKLVAECLNDSFTMQKRPVIIADGLITLHVLNKFCKNIASELFYCPTPLTAIAESILGEYLKVTSEELNELQIWAADDEIFHMEIEKPLIRHHSSVESKCGKTLVDQDSIESGVRLDYTQLNESWLKKEFIEKTKRMSLNNAYGEVSSSARLADTLRGVWSSGPEGNKKGGKIYCNAGVINVVDGARGEGGEMPMVLPIVLCNREWTLNQKYNNELVKDETEIIIRVATKNSQLIDYLLSDNDLTGRAVQQTVDYEPENIQ